MTRRAAPPPARVHGVTAPNLDGTVTAANSAQTPTTVAMVAAITSGDGLGATSTRYRQRTTRTIALTIPAQPLLTIAW
jgi:hypothetical protein